MDKALGFGWEVLGPLRGAAIFLIIIIAAEMAAPRTRYTLRERLRGATLYLLGAAAALIIFALLSKFWSAMGVSSIFALRFDLWFGWAGTLAVIPATISTLLVVDFFGYWYHRAQHRFLWPFHAVHHSVEHLHAANSYVHVSEELFRYFLVVIPLSLFPPVGPVQPAAIAVYIALSQFFIHSPTTVHFGPLRYVLTDNVYHRIHHSTDPAHFSKNFGTTFTLWDQIFGTAYFPKKNEWPERTGLSEIRQPQTVREWLDFPLRFILINKATPSRACAAMAQRPPRCRSTQATETP